MDEQQRKQLFKDHEKLIPKLANKYLRYGKTGVEYEELCQEAGLGLHLATKEFDPEKWGDKPFEVYAVTRMYQSMMRFFLMQNKLYVPYGVVALAAKIRKLNLTDYSISEIASKMGKNEVEVEKALLHLAGVHFVGWDEPMDETEGTRTIADKLPDNNNICFVEQAAFQMFIETLDVRERLIFDYILQGKTMDYIGVKLGVSRSSAGVYRRRVRDKFKTFMEAN